ncbi:MAG: mechanosensitive ion channel protein MscS [Bacteroidetes bacterium HGW-Bacteroidetes-21]|jgi:small-conductance mechanosensitive channel|nr:MAG: mechanosensitive ion channel protein MscS [Bacteroidetes bacterium HGW-Bacteroidetes-21]
MTFKEILAYSFISTENVKISVFTLLVLAISILFTIILLKIIKHSLYRFERKGKIDKGSVRSIFQIIKYVIWIIAIGIILDSAGFKLTLLLASSAALLVGLGLGIQHIFNDYVSGVLILFEHNIKVGDVLEIENNTVGRIEKIGLRTSKLKTRDDIIVVIPNSKLISENTINWSLIEGKTRFNIKVGVAYGSDTNLVEKVLLECASKSNRISTDPKPFVRFLDFGESSLDFQLFFWTNEVFRVENIKSELRFLVDAEFRKNKIQIPFPQRDLHIISDKTKTLNKE